MPKVGKAVSDTGDQNKPRSHTTNVRFGSTAAENTVTNFCPHYPQQQSFRLWSMNGRFVPTTVICSTAHWHIAMSVEEPSTASEADMVWAE